MDTPNLFSGLVFCADCGGTPMLHRARTMQETQNNFMCSTYKKRGPTRSAAKRRADSQNCPPHHRDLYPVHFLSL
ncbi:zinc ribbon domain-containing protein [Desulfoscipio gibsoniae]